MTLRIASLAVVVFLLGSTAWAGDDPGSAHVITGGAETASGVEAQIFTIDSKNTDSSNTSSGESRSDGVAMPTGLIPHSCVPVYSGGIDLDYVFAPGGSADCASFISPAAPGPSNAGPPNGPSPEELAAIAADRAMSLAEAPQLEMAPGSIGLTGLRSFFWLAREPRSVIATAQAPGLRVTAEAHPIQYVWRFGDGVERTTDHPGRHWTRRRPGNIAHMYETKGHYTVEVDVVWSARWRIGAGAWMPLGYFTNSDSDEYPVRQIRPALTRDR